MVDENYTSNAACIMAHLCVPDLDDELASQDLVTELIDLAPFGQPRRADVRVQRERRARQTSLGQHSVEFAAGADGPRLSGPNHADALQAVQGGRT